MQMVIVKSAKGSITIRLSTFLNFFHAGQHSQMRKVSAKVYQHGGHFCLDSSSSEKQTTTTGPLSPCSLFNIWPGLARPPTLHCACYDTSYTLSSLSGLRALQEVHKLLVSSPVCSLVLSGVSGVTLKRKQLLQTQLQKSRKHKYLREFCITFYKWKEFAWKTFTFLHQFHLNIYRIMNDTYSAQKSDLSNL